MARPEDKKFYNSRRWKNLRRLKLSSNPLCELCEKAGLVVSANQVDHITSIQAGGDAASLDNLMSLCTPCHSRKTVLKDGGFGRQASDTPLIKGCDDRGKPLDPNHPWNTRHSDCE